MKPKEIIIHHTASSRDKTTVEDINNWHKAKWPELQSSLGYWVGYHYVIIGNGQIIQTRKDYEISTHCPPNEGRIGIALTGNFDIEQPSSFQLTALQVLLEKLKTAHQISDNRIFGHREKGNTSCPGKNLMLWILSYRQLNLLQNLVRLLQQLILKFKK